MTDVPFPGQPVRGSSSGRPIMALLDLLGRAWSMGIVWQLSDGPLTFRGLQTACGDVSPTLLNRRLKELRTTGLVDHDSSGYQLTALGRVLFAHIEPLGDWSKTWASAITDETWA